MVQCIFCAGHLNRERTMRTDPSMSKVYSRVRDEAAFSSAMLHVADAETWAARMEKKIVQGHKITPALLLETIDNNLSGYQACYAYQIILVYWYYRHELKWDSLLKVPRSGLKKESRKARRHDPKRKPPTYH